MSALSDIVAKFRKGSPNIAAAFDEVERRLVVVEDSTSRAWVELGEHEARLDALEGADPDPPPDPPPTGEPTLQHPYASTSIFNTLIGSSPNIHPDSATIVGAANNNEFMPTLNSTPSLYEATASTPLVSVIVNHPTCAARTEQVPIVSTWRGGNGGFASPADAEPCMVVRTPSGDEWSLFKITPPNQTPLVSSGGPSSCPARPNFAATRIEKGSWKGSGTGPTYRGSGTLAGTGMIMAAETQQTPSGGDWGHALAMAYSRTRQGSFVAPASTSDGQHTGNTSIPMGARFWLPPGVYDIEASGLREWQKQMLRTIRKYGIVVVDSGSAIVCEGLASVRARGLRFKWEDDGGWLPLPAAAVSKFKVVVP